MSISTSQAYKDKFDALVKSWTLKLFIKDDNGKYVHFSDRTGVNGKNLLKNIGKVGFVQEKKDGTGSTKSAAVTATLDNSSRFFSKPFSNMIAESGAVASFKDSKNAKQSILFNRDAQIRMSVVFSDGREEEGIVATYTTGSLSRSKLSPNVSLVLRDKSLRLRNVNSAERVKDGLSYYSNRNISFLVKECLKVEFAQADGTLPSSFEIPDKIVLESAASITGVSGDKRVVSHYGRQPEIDTSGTFLKNGLICRAQVIAPTPANLSSAASPIVPEPFPDAKTLYMGCDDELWRWDAETEQATLIDDSTLGAGAHIRRLWYSSEQLKIYGVAYSIQTTYDGSSNPQGETVSVFKYDGTSLTVIATLTNVHTGDFCFRGGSPDGAGRQIGQGGAGTLRGENIVMPYGQSVLFAENSAKFREKTSVFQTAITGTPFEVRDAPFRTKTGKYYLLMTEQIPAIFILDGRWVRKDFLF